MKFYMKHILILIIFLTGLIGCSKNKFEVDSIDDKDYLSIRNNVDELPVVKIPDSNRVYDNIQNKFKQLMDSKPKKSLKAEPFDYLGKSFSKQVDFMCRVYLDEEGKIDKLIFIIDPNGGFKNFIVNEIKKWKFIPAKNNGENVKFQFDWMITQPAITSSLPNENFPLAKISASKTEAEINKIIKNLPDEMPEPLGGIKVIQEKIHYPEIAKRAGIEGKVLINAYIDEKGNVIKTKILKKLGHGLDEAAATAVAQTKFKPAKKNDKTVESQVVVPVLFKLDSSK